MKYVDDKVPEIAKKVVCPSRPKYRFYGRGEVSLGVMVLRAAALGDALHGIPLLVQIVLVDVGEGGGVAVVAPLGLGEQAGDVDEADEDREDDERWSWTKIRILVLTNNWLVGFIPSIFAEGELLAWIYLLFAFHFQCLPTKET